MRSSRKLRFALLVALVGAVLTAAVAAAAPIGVQPGAPPLAGVSFVPSGDIGLGGGLQYAFSGVPTVPGAQFQTLEWGPTGPSSVKVGLDGAAHVLNFDLGASNLAAGSAVWSGSSLYTLIDPFGIPVSTNVLTRVRFSTPGLPWQTTSYGGGATVAVSGNFSATLFFEVSDDNGVSWQPAKVFYNSHNNTGENLMTDVGEGFFYTPVNAPVASLDATSFDYGAIPVGTTSAAHTFTLSNLGTANLNVGAVTSVGDFTIKADNCTGAPVAPNGSCTIDVAFTPSQASGIDGSVTISDDAAGSPRTISLHGFGQQPAISVTPSSIAFPDIGVGSTTPKQMVQLMNTGDAPLHVSSVALAGANSADFTVTPGTCGVLTVVLAQGNSCLLNVTFTPSAGGNRSATLQVASDDPGGPRSVSLTGKGLVSHFALSPSPLAFGSVLTGQAKTLTLTLSNSGSDPASLTGPPTTSGPNPGDFAPIFASLTCPTAPGGGPFVPAHGSCSVDFTFTPGGAGSRSATFTFPNDSLDGPQSVTMTGSGVAPVATLTVPASVDFGTLNAGQSSTRTLTLTSNGTIPVSIGAAALSGADYAVVTDACSGQLLAPGNSCSVTLKYTASATPGASNGTLKVTSNAVGSPQTIPLTGASTVPADLNVSIGVNTKVAKQGGSLVYTITVFNAGPGPAPATTIVDALPSTMVFASLVAPAGATCTKPAVGASGTLKCNVGTVAAGASVSLAVTVKVTTKKSSVTNGASATSTAPDPDPLDNQASVTTPVK
jgi:uncharacterized repeat protein (TIGR01451 family)